MLLEVDHAPRAAYDTLSPDLLFPDRFECGSVYDSLVLCVISDVYDEDPNGVCYYLVQYLLSSSASGSLLLCSVAGRYVRTTLWQINNRAVAALMSLMSHPTCKRP